MVAKSFCGNCLIPLLGVVLAAGIESLLQGIDVPVLILAKGSAAGAEMRYVLRGQREVPIHHRCLHRFSDRGFGTYVQCLPPRPLQLVAPIRCQGEASYLSKTAEIIAGERN